MSALYVIREWEKGIIALQHVHSREERVNIGGGQQMKRFNYAGPYRVVIGESAFTKRSQAEAGVHDERARRIAELNDQIRRIQALDVTAMFDRCDEDANTPF